MPLAKHAATMTRDEFLDWAQTREERYEFDGEHPVAMTGATGGHSLITINIYLSVGNRLRGRRPCRVLGPDAGIATVGEAVRYPDALITCTPFPNEIRIIPNPIVVFEVLSPTSHRTDRVEKPREYWQVPSIRRYVLLENTSVGLTVFSRAAADRPWTETPLTRTDDLPIPEVNLSVPVLEFYDGLDFAAAPAGD